MSFVRISLKDWLRELAASLEDYYTAEQLSGDEFCREAYLIDDYVEWAAKFYAEKDVPCAYDLANIYAEEAVIMLRQDEDTFLMHELGDMDHPMSDSEWDEYCQSKGALFHDSICACLTDGFIETLPPSPSLPYTYVRF